VAEWMACFTDLAARQQQTADAFAELLQVYGARRTRRPCSAAWARTNKCRAQAEFPAIVAELARVDKSEKKHASKFTQLTAAADTMRAESADSLAEAMLRQTNNINQQTSYETIRFQVQRTAGQLHQSDFERRADFELLLEQLRQAGVQETCTRPPSSCVA
jgi:hypothetical protein